MDKDTKLIYEAYAEDDQSRIGMFTVDMYAIETDTWPVMDESTRDIWYDEKELMRLIIHYGIDATPDPRFGGMKEADTTIWFLPANTKVKVTPLGPNKWDVEILPGPNIQSDILNGVTINGQEELDFLNGSDMTMDEDHPATDEWLDKYVDFSSSSRARAALRGLR